MGSCRLFSTTVNKLQQKTQINLQNKKKKPHHKKITGFQFAPDSSSEVLITPADSRIRVVDGVDLVHKLKGSCWLCCALLGLHTWFIYRRAVCNFDFVDV